MIIPRAIQFILLIDDQLNYENRDVYFTEEAEETVLDPFFEPDEAEQQLFRRIISEWHATGRWRYPE